MTDKGKIFTSLAALPDDDPRLVKVASVLFGDTQPEQEPWLTGRAVARRLGLSWSTLHRAGIQSIGRMLTPGGALRYRFSDVERFLDGSQGRGVP